MISKKEQDRQYYLDNREAILQRVRRYNQANIKKVMAYQNSYHANPAVKAKRKLYIQQYNAENSEAHVVAVNLWRHENPNKAIRNSRKYVITRRARKQNASGYFQYSAWLEKCSYHGWKCFYCPQVLTEQTVTVDHRKPLSKSGSNWLANLVPACKSCNSRKQANLNFQKVA